MKYKTNDDDDVSSDSDASSVATFETAEEETISAALNKAQNLINPERLPLTSSIDTLPRKNSRDYMPRPRPIVDGKFQGHSQNQNWIQTDQEARFIASLGLSNAEKALLCLDQRSSTSSTSLPATPSDVDADLADNIRDYHNFIAPELALPLPTAQRSPKALKSCLKPLQTDVSPVSSRSPSPLPSPTLKPSLKLKTDVEASPGLLSPNSALTSPSSSSGGVRTAISFQEPPNEELDKLRAERKLRVKPIKPMTYNHERQMMRKRQQILSEMMAKNDSGTAAALLTATNAAIVAAAPSDSKKNHIPVIAIIGGSYAGLACLRQLTKKKLKTPAKFVLIEQRNFFLHTTQVIKALVHGDINAAVRDFSSSLQSHIVQARVVDINDDKKEIHLDNKDKILYDQLIIATGIGTSDLNLREKFTKNEAIESLRDTYTRLFQSPIIGIVGDSYAAIELAGELCIKYGAQKRIHLIIPGRLIPNADQELSDSIWEYMEGLGVIIHVSPTIHVEHSRIYAPDYIYTDYMIDTRVQRANFFPSFSKAYPKVFNNRKLACRPSLQLDDLNLRHVFAIGDISSFSSMIPASHFTALHTGSLTGKNLVLSLNGEWKLGSFYKADVETMAEQPVYNIESCGISVGGGVVLRKIPPRTRSRSLSATFKSGSFKTAFTKTNASSGFLAPPAASASTVSISSASSVSSSSSSISVSITEAKPVEYKDLAKLIV